MNWITNNLDKLVYQLGYKSGLDQIEIDRNREEELPVEFIIGYEDGRTARELNGRNFNPIQIPPNLKLDHLDD